MQQEQPEYVLLDKELIKGLNEKDVEIEHLKSTVFALQEKNIVYFKFLIFFSRLLKT